MHVWQAGWLAQLRPAQWIQRVKAALFGSLPTNAAQVVWTVTLAGSGGAGSMLQNKISTALLRVGEIKEQDVDSSNPALKAANFRHHSSEEQKTEDRNTIKLHFFTARKQWLDVIDLDIVLSDPKTAVIKASSCSTGIAPASSPFAIFASIAMCFVSFDDFGQNYNHLKTIKKHLEDHEFLVEERKAA